MEAIGALTTLVVATSNRGKLREFKNLLRELPVEVIGVSDVLEEPPSIEEDGESFAANALRKARTVAEAVTMLTLADDSGLEVDALGGRPGLRSARFAHQRATDAENNAALLDALAEVPDDHRRARFRCALALSDPWGDEDGTRPLLAEGTCEGWIAHEPRGSAGFGYDPLFLLDGQDRTMAELTGADKHRMSHRARAVDMLRPALKALLEGRADHARRIARSRI
jgi:XTP/dITP diphosphohydrolase